MSAVSDVIRQTDQATTDLHGHLPDRIAVSPDLYDRLVRETDDYCDLVRGYLFEPIGRLRVCVKGVPVIVAGPDG